MLAVAELVCDAPWLADTEEFVESPQPLAADES